MEQWFLLQLFMLTIFMCFSALLSAEKYNIKTIV